MKTILLSGFEPFGGDRLNPSQQAAEALDGLLLDGVQVRSALLPVNAERAPQVLRDVLNDLRPDAALLCGLAAGRPQLSLERVAVNVQDFRLPDNAGLTRSGEAVVPGGPDAYLSTLPLPGILAAWRAGGLPGFVSDTAGLYLCNLAFYVARHALGSGVPCGFLHLPASAGVALDAKQPIPYLPQTEITRGVRLTLEVLARHISPELAPQSA